MDLIFSIAHWYVVAGEYSIRTVFTTWIMFQGSAISDVDIFDECGILQQILVMPYFLTKGSLYNIFYILTKQRSIFISSFLGKRDAFTKEEVMLTKRIAKARILHEKLEFLIV